MYYVPYPAAERFPTFASNFCSKFPDFVFLYGFFLQVENPQKPKCLITGVWVVWGFLFVFHLFLQANSSFYDQNIIWTPLGLVRTLPQCSVFWQSFWKQSFTYVIPQRGHWYRRCGRCRSYVRCFDLICMVLFLFKSCSSTNSLARQVVFLDHFQRWFKIQNYFECSFSR